MFISEPFSEPARKRTRLSPISLEEDLCLICHKKRWRKAKPSQYTGDIQSWVAKISSENKEVIERIFAAHERGMPILYHASCYLSSCYVSQSAPSYPNFGDDIGNVSGHEKEQESSNNNQHHQIIKDAAMMILSEIFELKRKMAKKPVEISKSNADEYVPECLTLLLSCIIGCDKSDMISSIGQDIVYASTSLRTPKHVSMAMTIRQLTGSRKLVTILNKFGHSCTYIDSVRTECEIANSIQDTFHQLGVYIPSSIKPGGFVFCAADNIDFQECTMDGKGTTHGTNMVMFQQQVEDTSDSTSPVIKPGGKRLSLNGPNMYESLPSQFTFPTASNIVPYHISENVSPDYVTDEKALIDSSIDNNRKWVDMRKNDNSAPTWHAYNARNISQPVKPTTIAYLPMLDAPATEYETIFKTIQILQRKTAHLGQKNTVIFFDQAMYSKAMELVFANPDTFGNTVLMMGGFHINMNYLSAVGKVVADLGWNEIFTQSGIFSKSVTTSLLSAKPYSRCLAAHLALYETLSCLKSEADKSGHASSQNPLYKFWSNYIYLIDLCLTQLFAEKTGDWELYVQILTAMVPVFFSTDRQN